jgi:hypothetical protein
MIVGMIRTRDFLLFLLLIAFLLSGIVLTVWSTWDGSSPRAYSDDMFNQSTATMTAEVVPLEDGRQGRIETLRKKLATMTESLSAPDDEPKTEEQLVASTTATSTEEKPKDLVQKCDNYRSVRPAVLNGMLVYQETGGQRTFMREVATTAGASTTGALASPEVAFTLPIRSNPLDFKTCLTVDVVAVTPAGLPIYNSDFAKYSGSGEGALVGYTLDGFSLYGQTSNLETDECGGIMVGGSYRYYLSAEREAVLNCFAGIPVAL